uniref:SET domain-containing protein n=1 Tax=Panagrolaimus sp. PS1159 TaxID=55785 RepID=A0AC35GQ80_9BILA
MRGKRMLGSKAEADDLKIGDNRSYSMRIPGTLKVMNSRNAKEGLVHKVNNSCRPNCIIKWLDSRFWLISTECIAKGAEITVSYRLTWCNTNSPRFCFCKSIECIGMLEDAYELIAFRKSLNGINQDSANFLPFSSTTCPEFTAVPEVSPSSTNIQELAETHSREDFDDGNSLTVDPAAADDVDHEFDNDFDYSFTRNDTETMIEST